MNCYVSNHTLELRPAVANLADQVGWAARVYDDNERTREQHAEG